MRFTARVVLALVLLSGLSLLSWAAPASAQEDEAGELDFSWTCQQLRCQFETTTAGEAVEGNVTSITWTFGPDGETAEGNPMVHTFEESGTYEVQLSVLGNATGNATPQANVTHEVTVSSGEVPWTALGLGGFALVGSVLLARAT